MKILILYRPNSEFARQVETFVHDFTTQHVALANIVNLVDFDTREGVQLAAIHDIMAHPAFLVLREDNTLVKDWRDGTIPQISEVANYIYGAS